MNFYYRYFFFNVWVFFIKEWLVLCFKKEERKERNVILKINIKNKEYYNESYLKYRKVIIGKNKR